MGSQGDPTPPLTLTFLIQDCSTCASTRLPGKRPVPAGASDHQMTTQRPSPSRCLVRDLVDLQGDLSMKFSEDCLNIERLLERGRQTLFLNTLGVQETVDSVKS